MQSHHQSKVFLCKFIVLLQTFALMVLTQNINNYSTRCTIWPSIRLDRTYETNISCIVLYGPTYELKLLVIGHLLNHHICSSFNFKFLIGHLGHLVRVPENIFCLISNNIVGPTDSIFYGIWIKQIGAMVFIFNLDKVSLKKLFPTMNI